MTFSITLTHKKPMKNFKCKFEVRKSVVGKGRAERENEKGNPKIKTYEMS